MVAILVPIDFSEVSKNVVNIGGGMAKALGAHVTLLHVLPRNFEAEEAGTPMDQRALANLYPKDWQTLENLADQMRSGGSQVTSHLAEGKTVPTILEHADALNVDLIVMGSHGHTSLYDLLVGSVSEGVLRRSHWPVLIVPTPGVEKHRLAKKSDEANATIY